MPCVCGQHADHPGGPVEARVSLGHGRAAELERGQRVFADKLCRDVDKNLVELLGGGPEVRRWQTSSLYMADRS